MMAARAKRTRAPSKGRERGAVYVETLIGLPVVIYFFLQLWQLLDLYTAHLVVQHAAVAAVRAAVVVGPDDPRFYSNQALDDLSGGERLDDVKTAAALVLGAIPAFQAAGFKVELSGTFEANQEITAKVTADYACRVAALNPACGLAAFRHVSATASLPYQGAKYQFGDTNPP